MTQINDCSKFTSGTQEHTRCEGYNILNKKKQEQDADCNKRIEAAKKNSLADMMPKSDCKEKLPFQGWEDYLPSFTTSKCIAMAITATVTVILGVGKFAHVNGQLADANRIINGIRALNPHQHVGGPDARALLRG